MGSLALKRILSQLSMGLLLPTINYAIRALNHEYRTMPVVPAVVDRRCVCLQAKLHMAIFRRLCIRVHRFWRDHVC